MGRPMVKADRKAKQVQWTNVYLDALVCTIKTLKHTPVMRLYKSSCEDGTLFKTNMGKDSDGDGICTQGRALQDMICLKDFLFAVRLL